MYPFQYSSPALQQYNSVPNVYQPYAMYNPINTALHPLQPYNLTLTNYQPIQQYVPVSNIYQPVQQPSPPSHIYPQPVQQSSPPNVYQPLQQYSSASHMEQPVQQYASVPTMLQPYPQYTSFDNAQPLVQPGYANDMFLETQPSAPSSRVISQQCRMIKEKAQAISSEELGHALDEIHRELKAVRDSQQNHANLVELATAIVVVKLPTLTVVAQHDAFGHFRAPLIDLLRQWRRASYLNEGSVYLLRSIVKATVKLSRKAVDTDQYPSWLFDPLLLEVFAVCLTSIGKSGKFLHEKNKREANAFVRLFDIYIKYQTSLHEAKATNQDVLNQFVEPTAQCLKSSHYIDLFSKMKTNRKATKVQEKLFLYKCPLFLASYHGTRLEQVMEGLLSTMLPQYLTLFNEVIPSISQWQRPTMRAVNHLIKIISHGPNTPKTLAAHLPIIDHVLTMVDTSILYNKLAETLSNPETALMNTAVSFLATMLSEPAILAHIKQKKMTPAFLRLTSCQYEPLVYSTYNILAHTTTEKDISEMRNPGALLSTVARSLKGILAGEKSDDQTQVPQLLEILKGLTQHDQIKEEILKQDTFSFLLECTKKLTGDVLTLLLETLWSLSFSQKGALELRRHPEFLEKIQSISKSTSDEGMKKASDGLVWKLVQEPAFLEKIAKQQDADGDEEKTTEVIIGPDGKEQIVTKTKHASIAPAEQTFQYDMMISYCHADKDLIGKIHQFLLGQGFKIWIDLNNMFGPAMSAMADAVENSEFVLLCMSDSYKQSTYCQAEAEYAFGCKRRLLPLIVRPGYKADGWLGFMIGSRIYVDFGRFDFDTACDKLMNEIALQRKRPLPSKEGKASQHEKPDDKVTTSTVVIEKLPPLTGKVGTLPEIYTKRKATFHYNHKSPYRWTESDVLDFLYNNQANEFMPLCEKMDGRALIQLYKMGMTHANDTYALLNDELKSVHQLKLPIGVYTRFLSVLERVVEPHLHAAQSVPRPLEPPRINITAPPTEVYIPRPALPPPSKQSYVHPYARDLHSPYDIVVTSNAPASELFKLAERVVPHVRLGDPTKRQRTLYFR